ncbi:MAG: SDR family oxidoreductase [Gemmatimonadetes bacterium]|nr:SDR family oxidoreductase [Gemmatimonadota bacterium]MCA9762118.1 SDR family oxidoreductase [Gemmatimonadota bacterium]MCB9517358.1 SDR family oxidoreductase [Gemmatimonadales bacterium]
MISLAGRRLLVTGGSRGIGRATALLAAQAGADVGVLYHTRRAEADTVARAIRAMGRRAFLGGGDLADADRVAQLMSEVRAAFGGLDGLVVNHGIWPATETSLARMAPERWRRTMAADLDSVFLVTRAALGLMDTGGRVVMVASTAAQRGEAFHADYAAAKGAMVALVKSLAVECAPGITVNAVAPGWVATEMTTTALAGDAGERAAAGIPLGRVASAEDVAGPILFLLSDLARHVTGEILNVNGGSVLCG